MAKSEGTKQMAALADSHFHLFQRGFPGSDGKPVLGAGSEIETYEAYRREHAIVGGLVIGYEGDGIDPDNNRYIRALARTRPWTATLAYVDINDGATSENVRHLLGDGHLGIVGYAPDRKAAETIAAWPDATWRILDDQGAIISINATPEAMPALAGVVSRYARCRFLFAHVGLPGRYAETPGAAEAEARISGLLGMADSGNVLVKISGLYAISDPASAHPHEAAAPFVKAVLDRFGPERCLWASDFSPALEFLSFEQTVDNPWLDDLAPEDRDRVMGGNLLALLRGRGWTGAAG
ncbi:amidohydrolase family protein [Bauldia litoralis]|uniref:amidohydrolase family protein n=1 Tax=Bauldia litoralis TaxID=665467 RepID=UPI0032669C00